MRYEILMSPEAIDHLREFSAREQMIILDEIEKHLQHEPAVETCRRKRLRPNPLSPWELRIDQFRVFYDIEIETARVCIVAVGRKRGNRLFIGRTEVKL